TVRADSRAVCANAPRLRAGPGASERNFLCATRRIEAWGPRCADAAQNGRPLRKTRGNGTALAQTRPDASGYAGFAAPELWRRCELSRRAAGIASARSSHASYASRGTGSIRPRAAETQRPQPTEAREKSRASFSGRSRWSPRTRMRTEL